MTKCKNKYISSEMLSVIAVVFCVVIFLVLAPTKFRVYAIVIGSVILAVFLIFNDVRSFLSGILRNGSIQQARDDTGMPKETGLSVSQKQADTYNNKLNQAKSLLRKKEDNP